MHDGSIPDLVGVIDHYAEGRPDRRASRRLRGFRLEAGERADLVAFLHGLTDPGFLEDARFSDPFADQASRR